jgi:hypothetical protein
MTATVQIPDDHPCELISQEDRQWFDDHPKRVFRLRFATDGDPGGCADGHFVLVFCYTDGMRIRIPFELTTMPFARVCALMEFGTDTELSHIFGTLNSAAMRASVRYVDGSAKDARPLAEFQKRLYDACRKRGRRLTKEEFKRLNDIGC